MDAVSPMDSNDPQKTQNAASAIAKIVGKQEGGKWCGVVWPDGQGPEGHPNLRGREAEAWVVDHILNGPDGPGRRFLEKLVKAGKPIDLTKAVAGALMSHPVLPEDGSLL